MHNQTTAVKTRITSKLIFQTCMGHLCVCSLDRANGGFQRENYTVYLVYELHNAETVRVCDTLVYATGGTISTAQ